MLNRKAFLRGSLATAALPLLPARQGWAGAVSKAADLREIAPGVHVYQGEHALFSPANAGAVANCGVIIGNDAAAVVDTGGSAKFGRALKAAIRALTDRPIRYVINTHMHPDHVFGNAAFQSEGTTFVAHHKLARGLAARADRYLSVNRENLGAAVFHGTSIVLPDQTVEDRTKLDLGGRELQLVAHETAHTDNDLTVRDATTDTLFLGDLLFVGHTPAIDGSITGWLSLIKRLKAEPAARVVPGHGPASLPWPEAILPQERYLETIASEIRSVLKNGGTMQEAMASVGRSEKNAWHLFEEYHARNISAAFAELEWE